MFAFGESILMHAHTETEREAETTTTKKMELWTVTKPSSYRWKFNNTMRAMKMITKVENGCGRCHCFSVCVCFFLVFIWAMCVFFSLFTFLSDYLRSSWICYHRFLLTLSLSPVANFIAKWHVFVCTCACVVRFMKLLSVIYATFVYACIMIITGIWVSSFGAVVATDLYVSESSASICAHKQHPKWMAKHHGLTRSNYLPIKWEIN